MRVFAEMERHAADPWKVRDRMLKNRLAPEGCRLGGVEGCSAERAFQTARG
jgi:hypothetical protein